MKDRAERIASIREWHELLRARYDHDPRVGGYVRDVHFLLTELAVRDSQVAVIERAPTEPLLAVTEAAIVWWNAALMQAVIVIATEFGRARASGGNLYDTERKVQDAVRGLRRGDPR